MRFGLLVSGLLAGLAISHAAVGEGQFQEISKAELQMMPYANAPGSDAVYLYREEGTDDTTHSKFFHERRKVFTEKGKEELAIVQIPYVYGITQVSVVKARTIHPDGTIVPMTAEPADLVDVKVGKLQVNKLVITFPSVEVGSILEYRAEFKNAKDLDSEPLWDIQQSYPVRRARYSFHPAKKKGGTYAGDTVLNCGWSLPDKLEVNYDAKANTYTLDLSDVPPLPKEEWMPPLNTMTYRVRFYHVDSNHVYDSARSYWLWAATDWSRALDEITNPTDYLKKQAARLVRSGDSDEQKARKLYDAVQQLDNTDFSRTKSKAEMKKLHQKEIKQVEDVWRQRRGDRDEITLLFITLAHAAGLRVYGASVVDRSQAIFDEKYFSLNQLNDFIAVAQLDGPPIYLDPGEKMCPFGLLHWKHAFSYGLRQGYYDVFTTPDAKPKESVRQRTTELYLDRTGAVKGTTKFRMTGNVALYWRQLALENDVDELKKKFKETVCDSLPPGIDCELSGFQGLNDPSSDLAATLNISGQVGTLTGKRLFVPGFLFRSKEKDPFLSSDHRVTPIDVQFPLTEEDRITYRLPEGYEVETLPASNEFAWRDRAMLKTSFSFPPDAVFGSRTLTYNYTILPSNVYAELQSFYRRVAAGDQEQLVLSQGEGR